MKLRFCYVRRSDNTARLIGFFPNKFQLVLVVKSESVVVIFIDDTAFVCGVSIEANGEFRFAPNSNKLELYSEK